MAKHIEYYHQSPPVASKRMTINDIVILAIPPTKTAASPIKAYVAESAYVPDDV